MDMFTITEEVVGDYGVLTLTAPGMHLTITAQYDLGVEDYTRAVNKLVDEYLTAVQADNL